MMSQSLRNSQPKYRKPLLVAAVGPIRARERKQKDDLRMTSATRAAAIQRMPSLGVVASPAFHEDDDDNGAGVGLAGGEDTDDDQDEDIVEARGGAGGGLHLSSVSTALASGAAAAVTGTGAADFKQSQQQPKPRNKNKKRMSQHQRQMMQMEEMQQFQLRQFEALMSAQPSAYRSAQSWANRLLVWSILVLGWGIFLIGLTVATMQLVRTVPMLILLVVLCLSWPFSCMVLFNARSVLLGALPMVDRKTGHVIPPESDSNVLMDQMLSMMPQQQTMMSDDGTDQPPPPESKRGASSAGASGTNTGVGIGVDHSSLTVMDGRMMMLRQQQQQQLQQQQLQQQQQQKQEPVMAQADNYQSCLDHLTSIGMLSVLVPFLQQITIDRSLDEIVFTLVKVPNGIFNAFNDLGQGAQAIYILQFINYVFTMVFSLLMLLQVFYLRTYYSTQKANCKTPPTQGAAAQLQQFQQLQLQQLQFLQQSMRVPGAAGMRRRVMDPVM
jgi:hypothetical protein